MLDKKIQYNTYFNESSLYHHKNDHDNRWRDTVGQRLRILMLHRNNVDFSKSTENQEAADGRLQKCWVRTTRKRKF